MDRRTFLIGACATSLLMTVLPTPPALAAYVPTTRKRGTAVRNVKDYGAVGDGVHDDTNAFNNAINSLPSSGGTVNVPAGTYLIDPYRSGKYGIRPKSYMLLNMDPAAKLKAKTTSVRRSYIIFLYKVTNVEIAGGQLQGERATHRYTSGTTDEWNHGIQVIGGTANTIRDLWVGNCTGDGICTGGNTSFLEIVNVVSTNNRRQGLSLTQSHDIKVYDSEFSYTNGTSPECGIDVEPDGSYYAKNIWIENCHLHHNNKYGINYYNRAQYVTLTKCLVEYNHSCGVVVSGTGGYQLDFISNTIQLNSASGIALWSGNTMRINNNTFFENYTRNGLKDRNPDVTYTGYSTTFARDLLKKSGATNVMVGTNLYK